MKPVLVIISVIGIIATIVPPNVFAIHEEDENQIAILHSPLTQDPVSIPTTAIPDQPQTGTDDDTDSRLENPDEVQPQYGGPQGDPFCKITRTLADSPLGAALDSVGEGLDKYEKRCGDLDGENTEEDNLTMLESARDSKHTPIDLKNEISVGLDMIDCEKNDLTDSLSSNEREECDNLML